MNSPQPLAARIPRLRSTLNLNQIQFGALLGVHPMTVSKWERGELQPTPYQQALISAFEKAANDKEVKDTIGAVLVGAGIVAALYLLLKHSEG